MPDSATRTTESGQAAEQLELAVAVDLQRSQVARVDADHARLEPQRPLTSCSSWASTIASMWRSRRLI